VFSLALANDLQPETHKPPLGSHARSACRLPKVEQMRMADADLADSIRPVQLDSPEE